MIVQIQQAILMAKVIQGSTDFTKVDDELVSPVGAVVGITVSVGGGVRHVARKASTSKPGGIRTASMMCSTPLLAKISLVMTVAVLIFTTPSSSFRSIVAIAPSLRVVRFVLPLDKDPVVTLPSTVWYLKILVKISLLAGVARSIRHAVKAGGSALNAASVGPKTVNGPVSSSDRSKSVNASAAENSMIPFNAAVTGISNSCAEAKDVPMVMISADVSFVIILHLVYIFRSTYNCTC